MKKSIFSILLLLFTLAVQAQIQEPVKFKSELRTLQAGEAEVIFTGTIDKGWHVYSTDLGEGGPISATFNVEDISGAELVGKLKPVGEEIAAFDKLFEMKVRYFANSVQFVQKLKLTGGAYKVEGYLEYGACNDENCLPPTQVPFKFSGNAEGAAANEPVVDATADMAIIGGAEGTTGINVFDKGTVDLWKPVVNELRALGETTSQEDMSWIYIFITGFVGGLLALFTPCVWPIIPMTVSFFLKRSKDKKKGIRDAWTYGASIVVIYVGLGLLVTGLFGANALNSLSTNAVFNIFFFLMLVVFAASFFGAFEITLPSKWSNAVDSKAEKTGGLLSIFLMAFTLSLVSFSCTGPIIGFLLVQVSTTGNMIAPAIGMLGFAIALALPFTLFALFPSWLKSMPKSGGWMNVIKVTLGFLELAFALKFLSVADLAYGWRILDRETFLALWIVLFALLGFYLLGKIKFPHDDDDAKVSVPRFFMALASLAFAVYMLFALFPSWLKSMPKSGGWMNVIKVTLGFLELAFALKFLSVADLAYGWRILDRETFLALWIVLFALLGFYLLGKIKFPHDDDDAKVSVPRFFMALASLAFAVYMLPGLWGAPLKAVSAFAPPMQTQDFNLYNNEVHAKFDDYDLGMEYARQHGKPVMLDFTGYGCVNCRKMELAVWTDPKVSDIINNDYVLITLYVDNKNPLTSPVKITENGTERTLRTVGDKWSYLQRVKFGANAQPFYVLINNEGEPLNKSYSYDESIPKYIEFLQTGLENYKKER